MGRVGSRRLPQSCWREIRSATGPDDPTPSGDDDLLAVTDGEEWEGHDQTGPATTADVGVDGALGERIERAGRFLEHRQARIAGPSRTEPPNDRAVPLGV